VFKKERAGERKRHGREEVRRAGEKSKGEKQSGKQRDAVFCRL
jgi:hypothetical protein